MSQSSPIAHRKAESLPLTIPQSKSFSTGNIRAASSNITPDPSGIDYYDEALFIQVMRTGLVRARKLDPMMPYAYFKNFNDDDLKAMFAYLRTIPPVANHVPDYQPAGGTH